MAATRRLPTLDASWVIHWVRGPRTARRLGLPESYGLGDPAMLLPKAGRPQQARPGERSASCRISKASVAAPGTKRRRLPGSSLIDPRGDPAAIIAAIGSCRVLLSEAMHGAIVADTLRVPWIALRPLVPVHHAKWHDWAAALDLRIEFQRLAASSLTERLYASPLASCRRAAWWLSRSAEDMCADWREAASSPSRRGRWPKPRCAAATFGCDGAGPLPDADAGSAGRGSGVIRGDAT